MIKPKQHKVAAPKVISHVVEMRIPDGELTNAQLAAWYVQFEKLHGCTVYERIAQLEAEVAHLEAGGAV